MVVSVPSCPVRNFVRLFLLCLKVAILLLKNLVDLAGIEPATSSMPWKRAPSCATGPRPQFWRTGVNLVKPQTLTVTPFRGAKNGSRAAEDHTPLAMHFCPRLPTTALAFASVGEGIY